MKRKIMIPTLVVAASLAGLSGFSVAKQAGGMENEAADLAKAKISLSQAVSAAETQAGGKAVQAELDGERGGVVFKVEVVTADHKVMDVKVDANDGKVLSSQPDQQDHDEGDGADND